MSATNPLSSLFEAQRPRLRAVAYRMLGSRTDAEDAVQETWLRLSRSSDGTVENLGGWLTTVLSHICLDMLRARKTRGEDIDHSTAEPEPATAHVENIPEEELALADSVSAALLVVLQRLSPAERVAFVLHDMFDLHFEEIAPILDRTPDAARQLASRARRRVRGNDSPSEAQHRDREQQRAIVEAFLSASKSGDLQGILAVLDPGIVLRSDAVAVRMGGSAQVTGAETVAGQFKGRAQAARVGLIDDAIGVIVAPRGKVLVLLLLEFRHGKIASIEAIADPSSIADSVVTEL